MPRRVRIILANYPHHVSHRGHHRPVVFAEAADDQYDLNTVWEWKEELGCRVYAYCLMTNHVHWVLAPVRTPARLSLRMKRVAGRQARSGNAREGRRGTWWAGRFQSSPILPDADLLACCRYVELYPVRAGGVATPQEYRWARSRSRAGWERQRSLVLDEGDLSLGEIGAERAKHDRVWVRGAIPEGKWEPIREAIPRGQLTGHDRVIEAVARKLGRRVERRDRGRPRKDEKK